jgi:hypothetical protein
LPGDGWCARMVRRVGAIFTLDALTLRPHASS